jgi:hypothetical protein
LANAVSCLGKSPQGGGVGLDFGGLTQREVGLDGVHHCLVHAAAVLLSGDAKLGVKLGWETQSHGHTTMRFA